MSWPGAGVALAGSLILLAAGCGKHGDAKSVIAAPAPVKAMKPAPATPIDVKKTELGESAWNPQWDVIVEQAIPDLMLSGRVPHDVRQFCPRFL